MFIYIYIEREREGERETHTERQRQRESFPGGSDGKKSACNVGDPGLIPGSGRSLEKATHSSILAWRIPWMVELDRLQSMGVSKSQK